MVGELWHFGAAALLNILFWTFGHHHVDFVLGFMDHASQ